MKTRLRQLAATAWLLLLSANSLATGAAEPRPDAQRMTPRSPRGDADLRRWLENMVGYHSFSAVEVGAATGMTEPDIAAALKRFNIQPGNRPARAAAAPLLVLPYPGGRHPRIGGQESEIDPQRETKVSVFTPWDPQSYVVADVPEAIWWDHGGRRELLYLAHTDIPTTWDKQKVKLPPLEWQVQADGILRCERRLPNDVVFGTEIRPGRDGVRMNLWLTNGTKEKLNGLVVQNCIMLKQAAGFTRQSNDNKLFRPPFAACHNDRSDRWVITAWEPCHRTWANPPCPCIHSDPRFPDCAPGETVKLRGWLSFYEGKDIQKELDRLATVWRCAKP